MFNITEEALIKLVEYLIDNIYVSIGNRVYRQCVGIPMGTDCAPLLANLFLFYYEYYYEECYQEQHNISQEVQ